MINLENELIKRLLEYVKIDTQSDKESKTTPSTEKQKDLSHLLVSQLKDIGVSATEMDEYGYVYAHLPHNIGKDGNKIPAIGFIAHVDTSPDALGTNIQPVIHKNYDGKDIQLKDGVTISQTELKEHVGDTIITSDGTTLLGADDKAGIAEIITAMNHIIESDIKHGDIYLLFTTDEEIGKGTDKFDSKKFLAKSAYTFDGNGGKRIENETFNAAKATIKFKGVICHPGEGGFQKLKNAITISQLYGCNIPSTERPETTNERHGFYHANSIKGDANEVIIEYLLRDFDKNILEKRKEFLKKLATTYNQTYGPETITVKIKDQYPNMKEGLDKHPEVLNIAFEAAKKAGVEPQHAYIRGGTDGAELTIEHKIPCPNIFTGANNLHSVKEFASVKQMVAATNTLINIVEGHKNYHLKK